MFWQMAASPWWPKMGDVRAERTSVCQDDAKREAPRRSHRSSNCSGPGSRIVPNFRQRSGEIAPMSRAALSGGVAQPLRWKCTWDACRPWPLPPTASSLWIFLREDLPNRNHATRQRRVWSESRCQLVETAPSFPAKTRRSVAIRMASRLQ